MTPHETRDLFDELIDIARTVVCVADEGPDSARELGLCGGSPLVAACRAAVHRINAEAATVNPRAELSILRDQTAADVQTIATLQDEAAGRLREIGELRALLASAGAIAERKGEGTAWARFAASVKSLGISPVTARTYRRLDGDGEPESPTVASLQDENARLKAGRDSAEDELDTLKRQRDKAYADSAGLLLERNALRGENARLKAERDDAASWADLVTRGKGLCGHWKCYTYTEDPKGVRLDCLQCRAERVEAELATLKADAARREREALSHEDACVLSRIFNQYQLIQIDQYERINEFLKSLIESAFLTQRQEQSKP